MRSIVKFIDSVPFMRVAYFLTKPFVRKRIWLFCDRTDAAGDNAEELLKYVKTVNNRGIRALYAISKSSLDYSRVKKHYSVINRDSWFYKLMYLHSDKIISSHADRHVVLNCLGDKYPGLCDLLQFDFIFLSHGINKDDISKLYNKYNTNARLYTVVTEREYDSMFTYDYGYQKSDVVLTGFARYDKYKNNPQNKIVIAPTWRISLAGDAQKDTQRRPYRADFTESEYFNFYQSLISNSVFLDLLKKHDLRCDFVLHPSLTAQHQDFKGNKYVRIKKPPHDYTKILEEAKLLITDYSGVAFDFAYLKKPVVYVQFDQTNLYANHTFTKGFFSYDDDGFGPVTSNIEDAIAEVSRIVKNDFKLQKTYLNRINSFFQWTDRNNCRRIYQAIINIDSAYHIDKSIKKDFRFVYKRFKNSKLPFIKTYWWRYGFPAQLNFGDEITPYIIKSIWGRDCIWARQDVANLAGAGSIIETVQNNSNGNNIKIWGSGFIRQGANLVKDNLDFYAVRGPKSLARIKPTRDVSMGDPGLLANLVFRKSKVKTHKVGIVAHYVDQESATLDCIRDNPEYLLIDPLQTPDKVALDITSCEFILSSSLHGLIFSDSLGVPNGWMPLSNKLTGGTYKFDDYYMSTNRETVKVDTDVLGDNLKIDQLKLNYVKVQNLKTIQKKLIESFPY